MKMRWIFSAGLVITLALGFGAAGPAAPEYTGFRVVRGETKARS